MKILVLLIVLLAQQAWATDYYVANAPTGSDSNPGTSGSPFETIQKCINTVAAAGDTCNVNDGTYTVPDATAVVGLINTVSGTSGNPIILRSINYGGAQIVLPNRTNGGNYGLRIQRNYWKIEGLDISGGTVASGLGFIGIAVEANSTGTIITRNKIHNLADTVCSNTSNGFAGIYTHTGAINTVIERNIFHTIGRLKPGESGCSINIDKVRHDHGIYINHSDGMVVRQNVFYDVVRGYPIHVYSGTSATQNGLTIVNNTFADKTTIPSGTKPNEHILISETINNGVIRNNISYDAVLALLRCSTLTAGTVSVTYNLTDTAIASTGCIAGVTYANNATAAPGFTNAAARDYSLAAGSAAIGTGTDVGLTFNSYTGHTVPDKGALQTWALSSCVVESATPTVVNFNFQNAAAYPVLPSTGITGLSARENTVAKTNSGNGSRIGDNQVDQTVTAAFSSGTTIDVSISGSNLTDSSLIGGTLNQPFIQTVSNFGCTNNVAGAAYTREQAGFEWSNWSGTEAGSPTLPYGVSSHENISVLNVRKGGKVRLRIALKCNTADCPDIAYYPYFSTGGAYAQITNDFTSNDIKFCGESEDVPSNGSATTAQVTGVSGTFVAGGIVSTSNAIPTIVGLLTGYKTELAYCLEFKDTATGNFDIRLYRQNGSAIDTYTVTPRATMVEPASSGGM